MQPATCTPDRQRFRAVLAEMLEKAMAALPESNGRVEKGGAIVLAGDVDGPHEDGSWRVGSCTDPLVTHRVMGTSCSCDDSQYGRAPRGLCKHTIACMLMTRVREVLDAEALPAVKRPNVHADNELPEAPASCNVRVLVAGHEVQWTLRGRDEGEVFTRLQALLARQDVRPLPPKPAPRSGGQQWQGRKRQYQGA
jgi:hypothetical protein